VLIYSYQEIYHKKSEFTYKKITKNGSHFSFFYSNFKHWEFVKKKIRINAALLYYNQT